MKTMEMDGARMAKMNDFLEEFDWGWVDVIGVQAGGWRKPPLPPLLPQQPWKEILPDFDEDDGDLQ